MHYRERGCIVALGNSDYGFPGIHVGIFVQSLESPKRGEWLDSSRIELDIQSQLIEEFHNHGDTWPER